MAPTMTWLRGRLWPISAMLIITTTIPISSANLQCNVPGECVDSLLVDLVPQNNSWVSHTKLKILPVTRTCPCQDCWRHCKDVRACSWFTYYKDTRLCASLSTCLRLDSENCEDCISGEEQCPEYNCNIRGVCVGALEGIRIYQDPAECQAMCASNPNCNHYSFQLESHICTMTADCPVLDYTASHSVLFDKPCDFEVSMLPAGGLKNATSAGTDGSNSTADAGQIQGNTTSGENDNATAGEQNNLYGGNSTSSGGANNSTSNSTETKDKDDGDHLVLMVIAGADLTGVELVDLANFTIDVSNSSGRTDCQKPGNYPMTTAGASGGNFNHMPTVCGGNLLSFGKKCYRYVLLLVFLTSSFPSEFRRSLGSNLMHSL